MRFLLSYSSVAVSPLKLWCFPDVVCPSFSGSSSWLAFQSPLPGLATLCVTMTTPPNHLLVTTISNWYSPLSFSYLLLNNWGRFESNWWENEVNWSIRLWNTIMQLTHLRFCLGEVGPQIALRLAYQDVTVWGMDRFWRGKYLTCKLWVN